MGEFEYLKYVVLLVLLPGYSRHFCAAMRSSFCRHKRIYTSDFMDFIPQYLGNATSQFRV